MNIVKGTTVSLTFPKFSGRFSNPKFVRDITIDRAVCVRESYGDRNKHWFTFEVLESSDPDYPVGSKKRMQGKNAYPASTILDQPADLVEKTKDKNIRASYSAHNLNV